MTKIAAAFGQLFAPLFQALVGELFKARPEVSSVEDAEARLDSTLGISDEDHDAALSSRGSSLLTRRLS